MNSNCDFRLLGVRYTTQLKIPAESLLLGWSITSSCLIVQPSHALIHVEPTQPFVHEETLVPKSRAAAVGLLSDSLFHRLGGTG